MQHNWKSKTKRELMIEVWEALDCESIGRTELEAIECVVRDVYGAGAVELPMRVARQLADEGAALRHAEIMQLDVDRRSFDPYRAMLRNILNIRDLAHASASLKRLENLRSKLAQDKDSEGLRRVQQLALKGKRRAELLAQSNVLEEQRRREKAEIAEWFAVWLRQPGLFVTWLSLRERSAEFQRLFANADPA
jgi:hypothetical protein